jgi:hypothetical protein
MCSDISVTNNIAGGGVYAGFITPGHDCGKSNTQKSFKGNVAHSIGGTTGPMGHGALIFADTTKPGHKDCYEGSHFSAYKNKI